VAEVVGEIDGPTGWTGVKFGIVDVARGKVVGDSLALSVVDGDPERSRRNTANLSLITRICLGPRAVSEAISRMFSPWSR